MSLLVFTPADVLRFTADRDSRMILQMTVERARWLLRSGTLNPSAEALEAATQFMNEISGLALTSDQVDRMLLLYPSARANLAETGNTSPTDVRDALSDVLAHHILQCTWPAFGDKIDVDLFARLLVEQAIKIGYTASPAFVPTP